MSDKPLWQGIEDLVEAMKRDALVRTEGYTRKVADKLGGPFAEAFTVHGVPGLNHELAKHRRTALQTVGELVERAKELEQRLRDEEERPWWDVDEDINE